MNKKIIINLIMVSQLVFPLIVLADLGGTITNFTKYAFAAINFLLVLATLVFIWGIIKYITAGGDSGKVSEARNYIIWGLVGLAVMGSVWAVTRWVVNLAGGAIGSQTIPTIK